MQVTLLLIAPSMQNLDLIISWSKEKGSHYDVYHFTDVINSYTCCTLLCILDKSHMEILERFKYRMSIVRAFPYVSSVNAI